MRDVSDMRTTLTIDDDILDAARALADQRGVPIGAVISELARRGLAPVEPVSRRSGILLFPVRKGAGRVTPQGVQAIASEGE